jgi:hypothetical protein
MDRHQLRMISETHLLNASEYHRSHAALVEKVRDQLDRKQCTLIDIACTRSAAGNVLRA